MPKELGPNHIHEYVRIVKLDGTADKTRYRCAHPDCPHWQYKNLLKGKRSICAVCHSRELLLDREALRRAKPTCIECSNTEKSRSVRLRLHDLEELFKTKEAAATPEEGGQL